MALPSPTRTDDAVHAPYIPSREAPAELTPGVIVMIPLRRSLIVKEHANLSRRNATAYAAVLPIPVYAVARSRRSP